MTYRRPTTRRVQSRLGDRSAKQLGIALVLLMMSIAIGTTGYVVIEGWSFGDAIYMTIISITTTGFGEVRELTPAGRAVTVFVIVSGIASLAFVAGRAVQLAVERYLARRGKMDRQIQRMKNHVILCGYGRMGRHIAADLAEAGVPFVVLESNPELAATLDENRFLYIIEDASSDRVLVEAGADRARGLIAVLSSDAENVYTTLTARAINPAMTIVARALADESEPKLKTAGADRVIKPYEMVGRRIAQLVIRPAMVEFVESIARSQSGEITMEEITVTETSALVGKALRDTDIRSRLNVIVVAVRRGDDELIYNPGPDTSFEIGDTLVAIGRRQDVTELSAMCGASVA
jgi:voltage-gated potassium channel